MPNTRDKLDRLFPAPQSKSKNALYNLEKEVLGNPSVADGGLSVKERLERLVAATAARPPKPKVQEIAAGPIPDVHEVLQGDEVENELGKFYQVDRVYPLVHHHGRMKLERLKSVPSEAFSLLSRGDDSVEIDLEKALFLDTETTGLAGGSGTCPFLIGLGWVEDDNFVVRQLFMRDYGEEPAVLHALGELLARFQILVSYNGKTFDIPLLETRFILSRLRLSFEHMLHFDLLHPARSLWKARIESCRLMELEHRLLGLEREDDIPGQFIPDIYFRFVRGGDPTKMHHVFQHNRDDIVSLAALTVCASDLLDENYVPEDPIDDFSLGKLFERSDQPERSMLHFRRAVDGGVSGVARRQALTGLASQHKKRGEFDDARELWGELVDGDSSESILALHELAMVFEHHEKDYESALEKCADALSRLEENYSLTLAFRTRWRDGFVHREKRLRKRLEKGAP